MAKTSQIKLLIDYSLSDETNTYKEINFGQIANYKAQEINMNTGIKINGAMKILSSHCIIHVFDTHGDDAKEKVRGQKGITDADFELVPLILNEYDEVSYGGKNSNGKDSIVFKKEVGNYIYHVVMSVSKKKDLINLFMNTMYAKIVPNKTKKPM